MPGVRERNERRMADISVLTVNDGSTLPAIGFGTNELQGDAGVVAIRAAIEAGYRLIDTAVNYENEAAVGEAIRSSDVDRADLRISTKIPGRDHGYAETLRSFEESRQRLGVDCIDLYLIHWPLPRIDKYLESWKAMIELRDRGLVRSIGVSNFTETFIRRLQDDTGVTPAVNQVELHPYFPQAELHAFHEAHGIRTVGWSPLGKRSDLRSAPEVAEIARAYGVTPAQAVLRWHVQRGVIPIPKAQDPAHMRENLAVFGWSLAESEVAAISALERGRLWGGDPETKEEF
jgi:diketogulonate reductase-like aldo/keto reductase